MESSQMKRILIGLFFAAGLSAFGRIVDSSDPGFQVRGIRYSERTDSGLRFHRFREDILNRPRKELGVNPKKTRNATGGVLTFCTDSETLSIRFDILDVSWVGTAFGVYENGGLIREFFFPQKTAEVVLDVDSTQKGLSCFEVTLPTHADAVFRNVEICDDAELKPVPESARPVYVALGDSISHGVGQEGATHKTWPFLLSEKLNAELFNLAVGGGKVSVPIAEMLEDWSKIDLITVLVGYNDLHFDRKTPEAYRERYAELLDAIRAIHPETRIACITALYTERPESDKTGHSIQEFRDELIDLVRERQKADARLILIEGDQISSRANLRDGGVKDPVHLSVDGAAMLADELYKKLTE
jgi:lysophospholipase L1-like esterase